MARREDVNNLITNMQKAAVSKPRKSSSYSYATTSSENTSSKNNYGTPNSENVDSLKRSMDLTPYKQASVWPGRSYLLVGNSYNVEVRFADSRNYDVKRRASIAMMFESKSGNRNRGCVALEDALRNEGFVEVLSRFEFDWLRRMPSETLIGPAYDRYGNLIPQAFAVWRAEGARTRNSDVSQKQEHRGHDRNDNRRKNNKSSNKSSKTSSKPAANAANAKSSKSRGSAKENQKVLAASGKR